MTTTDAKSPAELMADLTDQVRLLRADVVNLTATAVTQNEAEELRNHLKASITAATAQARNILNSVETVTRITQAESAAAAREGAEKAIAGLSSEIRAAGNHLRLEALKSRRQGLYGLAGSTAVFGGLIALGAILGALVLFWLQGRADAHAFGEHPRIFCGAAGGENLTAKDGRDACVFWFEKATEGN